MGYNTEYNGAIHIENLNLEKVRVLNKYLGEDRRSIEGCPELPFYYFSIRLTDNMDGLEWNDDEKTYGMLEMLNFLQQACALEFREGDSMLCQGETSDDRYLLVVKDNTIIKRPVAAPEGQVCCPECEHRFVPGEE